MIHVTTDIEHDPTEGPSYTTQDVHTTVYTNENANTTLYVTENINTTFSLDHNITDSSAGKRLLDYSGFRREW